MDQDPSVLLQKLMPFFRSWLESPKSTSKVSFMAVKCLPRFVGVRPWCVCRTMHRFLKWRASPVHARYCVHVAAPIENEAGRLNLTPWSARRESLASSEHVHDRNSTWSRLQQVGSPQTCTSRHRSLSSCWHDRLHSKSFVYSIRSWCYVRCRRRTCGWVISLVTNGIFWLAFRTRRGPSHTAVYHIVHSSECILPTSEY